MIDLLSSTAIVIDRMFELKRLMHFASYLQHSKIVIAQRNWWWLNKMAINHLILLFYFYNA